MAELHRRYPLDHVVQLGVQGPRKEQLVLTARNGVHCLLVLARRGMVARAAARLQIEPANDRAAVVDGLTICPTAPGQWLVLDESGDRATTEHLQRIVGDAAWLSDQSHARQVIRVAGPATRELLARGCRLDLHPRAAKPGFAAVTTIAEFGCVLHQIDATPTFDVVVASGYAAAFWHWLTRSATPFGYSCTVEQVG